MCISTSNQNGLLHTPLLWKQHGKSSFYCSFIIHDNRIHYLKFSPPTFLFWIRRSELSYLHFHPRKGREKYLHLIHTRQRKLRSLWLQLLNVTPEKRFEFFSPKMILSKSHISVPSISPLLCREYLYFSYLYSCTCNPLYLLFTPCKR